MIGLIVYSLCTATSLGCSVLLWRGYRRTKMRLLFWSALCFGILAFANLILIFDLVIFPEVYILPYRTSVTLIGLIILIYGLIFESD